MKSMKGLMLTMLCAPMINVSDVCAQHVSKSPAFTPWQPIAMKDVVWQRREVKQVDVNAPGNAAFLSADPPAAMSLADLLVFGALSGKITAYSAADDRFTTKLTGNELGDHIRSIGAKTFSHYLIKEDSLCVGPDKKLTVRIVGIAPMAFVKDEKGNSVEKPVFWIYYPDCREFLSQGPVYMGGEQTTWDAVFEQRRFQAKVVKTFDRTYSSAKKG